jgi:ribosomal protein L11 methyltransferase
MTLKASRATETPLALLETDEQSARAIGDLIAESLADDEAAVTVSAAGGGLWRVSVYFCTEADLAHLRAVVTAAAGPEAAQGLRIEHVAVKDWVSDSLAGLEPVAAGRFVVHGAHDRAKIPINKIGVEIEAALAFGTGHHGTTRGCLLALDGICKARSKRPPRVLDLGAGTGVLGIAAARALRVPVLATDTDANSVHAARGNAWHNGAGPLLTVLHADGVTRRAIRTRAPFDIVLANILLAPLRRLSTPLKSLTAPGARVVLSGVLNAQANAALAAYRPLALQRRIVLDGWTTLILARRATPRRSVARRRRAS